MGDLERLNYNKQIIIIGFHRLFFSIQLPRNKIINSLLLVYSFCDDGWRYLTLRERPPEAPFVFSFFLQRAQKKINKPIGLTLLSRVTVLPVRDFFFFFFRGAQVKNHLSCEKVSRGSTLSAQNIHRGGGRGADSVSPCVGVRSLPHWHTSRWGGAMPPCFAVKTRGGEV